METVEGSHLVFFGLTVRQNVYHQLLAEGSLILQMKIDSHINWFLLDN